MIDRKHLFGFMLTEVSVLGFQTSCNDPNAWLSIMVGSIWWSKRVSLVEDKVMREEGL